MTDKRLKIGSFVSSPSSFEDERFMVVVPDKLRLFIKEDIFSDTPVVPVVPFGVGVSSDCDSPFSQESFSRRTGDIP